MNYLRFVRYGPLTLLVLCGAVALGMGNQKEASFKAGVLHGKVLDGAGKPVPNATVAVLLPNGKPLGWAKTDANGEYRIAADPKLALNLKASHCRSLLEECVRAAGGAAMDAVRIIGSTVITPGNTVRSGAVAVAGGIPGQDVAAGTAASLPNAGAAPGQVGQAAGASATNAALLGLPKGFMPPPPTHGKAALLISAAGFKEEAVADPAYWLDPPSGEKKSMVGVQAWMQTIKLAPTAGDKKCELVPTSITLAGLELLPAVVPQGGEVAIKVKLNNPDPTTCSKMRIFARLACKNTVTELTLVPGQKDVYAGKMTLDPKTPVGPTLISVGALRSEPIEVKLSGKKADPLMTFAGRVDDMNGTKPYGYDPFVMASENRLDAKITVLEAKK